MNELDVISSVRDEVEEPSPARLGPGRARLMAEVTRGRPVRPRRRLAGWRVAWPWPPPVC
ncbi:hypothetical protein ACQP1W_40085 [Spirillospora sp. CA-255316]